MRINFVVSLPTEEEQKMVSVRKSRPVMLARRIVRPELDPKESVRETMRLFPKVMAELAK